jgi:hypothetical protein
MILAALTPILPFVLTWRLVSAATQKRKHVFRTLRSAPALLALNVSWALGELSGYLRGSPE